MARALRPAVLLMLLASLLFVLDGLFDGVYPGGSHWEADSYHGLGWTSYFFGLVNAGMALLIARGSERMLTLRIGLAAFFMVERSLTAFTLGPKPVESIVTHAVTAVVELVILLAALRVYRLGHSVAASDLDALLELTPSAPALATAEGPPVRGEVVSGRARLRRRWALLLALLTLLLAALLASGGRVPG